MRKDWVECKLEDIVNIVYGKGLPTKNMTTEGYDVFGANGIIGKFSVYNTEKPEVLISCRGAASGNINLSPPKCFITNNSLILKRIIEDTVDTKFLFYILKGTNKSKIITGTAQPQVTINNANLLKLPLPPLPEQRAIVKKIEALFSSLDAGIADLKKAQEQLKIYRQAVLKKAFEGQLTKSEMKYEKLSNLSTIIGDGLHGTPEYDAQGDYYFINGNNLQDGIILIKPETKRVGHSQFLKHKKELNDRTVFVSINGTIGNTAFYNNEPVILGKSACYVNLKQEIEKKYVRYNFKTTEFLNYALKNATGSTIKNVGLKTMRDYNVPVPKNLEEQAQIVKEIEARLSVCDAVEQQIKDSLSQAEALRQSILKKAFEGKLLNEEEIQACQQAPDYEPAAVLLEKIKAEKEANKPVKKTKKKVRV